MAKQKGKKRKKAKKSGQEQDPFAPPKAALDTKAKDPVTKAVSIFAVGDYVAARPLMTALAKDDTLSESQRSMAADLVRATRLDRGTVFVGLACVALYVLVVGVAHLLQP